MATRSPWPASTWRSKQLYATLSLPPTNHLANGARDQSSTSMNGVAHDSRRACFAQNASWSSSASRYNSAVAFACWANSAGGGYDVGTSVGVSATNPEPSPATMRAVERREVGALPCGAGTPPACGGELGNR